MYVTQHIVRSHSASNFQFQEKSPTSSLAVRRSSAVTATLMASLSWDILLVKLTSPVTFSGFVDPQCLTSSASSILCLACSLLCCEHSRFTVQCYVTISMGSVCRMIRLCPSAISHCSAMC